MFFYATNFHGEVVHEESGVVMISDCVRGGIFESGQIFGSCVRGGIFESGQIPFSLASSSSGAV